MHKVQFFLILGFTPSMYMSIFILRDGVRPKLGLLFQLELGILKLDLDLKS
jgi:hypothetical protein